MLNVLEIPLVAPREQREASRTWVAEEVGEEVLLGVEIEERSMSGRHNAAAASLRGAGRGQAGGPEQVDWASLGW